MIDKLFKSYPQVAIQFLVEAIVEVGTRLDIKNKHGLGPLEVAVDNDDVRATKILIMLDPDSPQSVPTNAYHYKQVHRVWDGYCSASDKSAVINSWLHDDWELIKAVSNPTRAQLTIAKMAAYAAGPEEFARWLEFKKSERIQKILNEVNKNKDGKEIEEEEKWISM